MTWLRCSACKRDLDFGVAHWVCSVSTCNRHNTNYKFCSVACWDSHVATLRHRDAWAVEARAPSRQAAERDLTATAELRPAPGRPAPAPAAPAAPAPITARPLPAGAPEPARRLVPPPPAPSAASAASAVKLEPAADDDVLIVVSKMKKYIRDRSGMSTSDAVAEALSDHVRALCDDAIRTAGADNRKTVLDRDVAKLRR